MFDYLPSTERIAPTCPDPDPSSSYPINSLEGNDNSSMNHKNGDPYDTDPTKYAILYDEDNPNQPGLKEKKGFKDSKFEERIHFKEFCRLEIGGKWYVISNSLLWRLHIRLTDNGGGHMRNNGSAGDFTNDGW